MIVCLHLTCKCNIGAMTKIFMFIVNCIGSKTKCETVLGQVVYEYASVEREGLL